MTDTPLWQLSAAKLAVHTRNGDISAEAAVQAAVTRMRAVNPDLNAVVVDTGEAALERARRWRRARAAAWCGAYNQDQRRSERSGDIERDARA